MSLAVLDALRTWRAGEVADVSFTHSFRTDATTAGPPRSALRLTNLGPERRHRVNVPFTLVETIRTAALSADGTVGTDVELPDLIAQIRALDGQVYREADGSVRIERHILTSEVIQRTTEGGYLEGVLTWTGVVTWRDPA